MLNMWLTVVRAYPLKHKISAFEPEGDLSKVWFRRLLGVAFALGAQRILAAQGSQQQQQQMRSSMDHGKVGSGSRTPRATGDAHGTQASKRRPYRRRDDAKDSDLGDFTEQSYIVTFVRSSPSIPYPTTENGFKAWNT